MNRLVSAIRPEPNQATICSTHCKPSSPIEVYCDQPQLWPSLVHPALCLAGSSARMAGGSEAESSHDPSRDASSQASPMTKPITALGASAPMDVPTRWWLRKPEVRPAPKRPPLTCSLTACRIGPDCRTGIGFAESVDRGPERPFCRTSCSRDHTTCGEASYMLGLDARGASPGAPGSSARERESLMPF